MTTPIGSQNGIRPGANSTYVTHLECSKTGDFYPQDTLHGMSRAGAPLIVRYDLKAVAGSVTKDVVAARPPDMWRYREFLPLGEDVEPVSLGEFMTPGALADSGKAARRGGRFGQG